MQRLAATTEANIAAVKKLAEIAARSPVRVPPPLPGRYSCGGCGGSGWAVGPSGASRCLSCPIDERLRLCGVPRLESEASLDSIPAWVVRALPKVSSVADQLRVYVRQGFGKSLVLWGPVGTAKTWLSCAVAREALAQNRSVHFIKVPTLLGRLKATFAETGGETIKDIMTPIHRPSLLILDELGHKKRHTEFELEILYNIIDSRWSACKDVLATTNLRLEELRDSLDDRLHSRLSQYHTIECSGPDLRKARARK